MNNTYVNVKEYKIVLSDPEGHESLICNPARPSQTRHIIGSGTQHYDQTDPKYQHSCRVKYNEI